MAPSAQQLMPADPSEPAIKVQVKNFEAILRQAVISGGLEIVKKAGMIVPGVQLQYVSDVTISGWPTAGFGYTFDVTIPEILPSSAGLVVMIQNQQPLRSTTQVSSGAPGLVTSAASTVLVPDPVKVPPIVPFDPIKEYSNISRQALIDAMVDSSSGLQFKPGEKLQVVAGPGPQYMPNPLQPESRKLILEVNGEDLIAFRKGDLKRDELLAKIRERRF